MLKLLRPVRLIVMLAVAGGGLMATKQAALHGMVPPGVMQAPDIIQDKQADLLAAFQRA